MLQIPIVVHTGQELSPRQQTDLTRGLTTFLTKTVTTNEQFSLAVHRALGH
ncbi:hypothetical protein N9D66_00330 [Candidatus Nanopelagicales bacterium]|nr:hypothetical protein [Candidatus Nanopelagicales bacterium]